MKAKISVAKFVNGWSWLIDVGRVSIEPYDTYKNEATCYRSAVRWCKKFSLDYSPKGGKNEI